MAPVETAAACAPALASSFVNPILVEMRRGDVVESVHRGAAAVATGSGEILEAWGDIDRLIFPRSAVKMLQALPLIESGAADEFRLTETEIALACASHNGERKHVHCVARWLDRIGLGAEALECGSQQPYDEQTALDLASEGERPTPLHHNCSGKHAGFLTIARHLGVSARNYASPAHPVQRMVTRTLSEMTELDLEGGLAGTDGCGVPAYVMPLRHLAIAVAKLGSWHMLARPRAEAAERIVNAIFTRPWFVAGSGRFDTKLIQAARGVVVKMGAEGMHIAVAPEAGVGIALKIDDGAKRAAELAMVTILRKLCLIDESLHSELGSVPIVNGRRESVAALAPAPLWAESPSRAVVAGLRS